MTVDVVILSKCTSVETFRVNENCIRSLMESEPKIRFEIVIVESNQAFPGLGFTYRQEPVSVIIPDEPFRFHRFLNIGLARGSSDMVLFSNNDVTYHPGWLSEILRVRMMNPEIRSFSPFDRNGPYLNHEEFRHKPFHIGHRVPVEFTGWCFLVDRSVFNQTGIFDERYALYFGDNDFARTLKRRGILHAMVPSSFVEHHGGYTTGRYDASGTPEYVRDREAYLKKWGDTKWRTAAYTVFQRVRQWFGQIPG